MDRKEVARLYESYAQDIFRLALSYLHNQQDAEDVCQAVYLSLLNENVQLFPKKEKAWLLTCTANACKNHLKSFWKRNVGELDESLSFCDETDKELWSAIMTLAPKYRAVIHLYYYEGYSQEDIAQILKLSRTAVQTRVSRARSQLKKELSKYE